MQYVIAFTIVAIIVAALTIATFWSSFSKKEKDETQIL